MRGIFIISINREDAEKRRSEFLFSSFLRVFAVKNYFFSALSASSVVLKKFKLKVTEEEKRSDLSLMPL